jgi:hypothetical protein
MFKTMMRAGALVGAAAIAFTALADVVSAATPPDIFKDGSGNVYIHGTAATTLGSNARISTNEPLTRKIRAGYCGEIRIATSSSLPDIGTSWTINGITRTTSNLTTFVSTDQVPRCQSNAFNPMFTGDGFQDSQGRVFLTGYQPGLSYDVAFDGVNTSRSIRPNGCGFFRLSNTQSNPLPSELTINSTTYTIASLPMADPPLCQRNSSTGTYVRYTPASW